MFKVWLVSLFLLVGLLEVYEWVKHFHLPLPGLILGGALLAIASNSQHFKGRFWQREPVVPLHSHEQSKDGSR
ncbi:MAG TPA: hypothetical protein V6D03_15270 [Candidatus Caenarcaniphilales bacterium]